MVRFVLISLAPFWDTKRGTELMHEPVCVAEGKGWCGLDTIPSPLWGYKASH